MTPIPFSFPPPSIPAPCSPESATQINHIRNTTKFGKERQPIAAPASHGRQLLRTQRTIIYAPSFLPPVPGCSSFFGYAARTEPLNHSIPLLWESLSTAINDCADEVCPSQDVVRRC